MHGWRGAWALGISVCLVYRVSCPIVLLLISGLETVKLLGGLITALPFVSFFPFSLFSRSSPTWLHWRGLFPTNGWGWSLFCRNSIHAGPLPLKVLTLKFLPRRGFEETFYGGSQWESLSGFPWHITSLCWCSQISQDEMVCSPSGVDSCRCMDQGWSLSAQQCIENESNPSGSSFHRGMCGRLLFTETGTLWHL